MMPNVDQPMPTRIDHISELAREIYRADRDIADFTAAAAGFAALPDLDRERYRRIATYVTRLVTIPGNYEVFQHSAATIA